MAETNPPAPPNEPPQTPEPPVTPDPPITDPKQIAWIKEQIQFIRNHPPINYDALDALLALIGEPPEKPEGWKSPKKPPGPGKPKPPEKPKEPPDKKTPKPPDDKKPPTDKPKPPPQDSKPKTPSNADLLIARTKFPKWWNDEGVAQISLSSPGSQLVITASANYSLYIATIVLTVDAECDISFTFGNAGHSGSMHFGGEAEPKGIVIAGGNSPTPCGSGSFMISASSADPATIGGYAVYYLWKKETK